jgi:hypothetical protein
MTLRIGGLTSQAGGLLQHGQGLAIATAHHLQLRQPPERGRTVGGSSSEHRAERAIGFRQTTGTRQDPAAMQRVVHGQHANRVDPPGRVEVLQRHGGVALRERALREAKS